MGTAYSSYNDTQKFKEIIFFNGGSSSNEIILFDSYAPNKALCWNCTSWLLNFLKLLFLLKWSIYRNNYLRFYNNIDQKRNLGNK